MIEFSSIAADFADSGYQPAEIHGLISAFCCAAGALSQLKQVLAEQHEADLAEKVQALYREVDQALADESLGFQLLLTDNDAVLAARTKGLAEWCQGFLTGFKLNHIDKKTDLSEECREALGFFSEIQQIEEITGDTTEEDEKDFTELEEYIRMSVLMMYTELRMEREDSTAHQTH